MTYMKIFIIILVVIAQSSAKMFLFGSILQYDNNKAYQKLIQVVGKPTRQDCNKNWLTTDCPKVAVITSACIDSQCGQDEYYIGDEQQAATGAFFQSLGMVPKHVSVHIDNYQSTTDVLTYQGEKNYYIIAQADIIYFNGGDQSRHIRCWFNQNTYPNTIFALLKRRIQLNNVVLVGVSAGTAAQSAITYGGGSPFGILYFTNKVGLAPVKMGEVLEDDRKGTEGLQYEQNGAKSSGFGFIKQFLVDTHFDARGRLGRLVPATVQMKIPFGVGIDQSACLYYDNGIGTVYGKNGVFITDISSALVFSDTYFKIKNVKLHYLTQGDSFNFKTNTYQTSKDIIGKPSQTGYIDSDHILSKYECTRLILRLVDQTGIYNQGETDIPEDQGYPIATPKFSFTFFKGDTTKGYQKNGLRSAFNVNLDVSAEARP